MTITVLPNPGFDGREASVILKCGEVSRTINVNQKQKDDITLTQSRFEVACEGGTIDIEVKSNIEYTCEVSGSAKDWIRQEETKTYGSSHVTFVVERNETIYKREGEIIFRNGDLEETLKVYQQGEEPTIILTQEDCYISSKGGSINVEVNSNVDVLMSIPQDVTWIREITTRSMSTSTFCLEVDPNTSTDPRTAAITFTNEANGVSESLSITQAQMDVIILSEDHISFKWNSSETGFSIDTNADISVDIPEQCRDWVTIKDTVLTKAVEKKEYIISVSANYGPERSAEVVFHGENCEAALMIIQDPSPIQVDSSELVADCVSGATAVLHISAQTEWSVAGYDKKLFSVSPLSGNAGESTLTVRTKSANCTNGDRNSTITLSSDGMQKEIPLRQIPAFKFDTLDFVIPAEGGASSFPFTFARDDDSVVKTSDYDSNFREMLNGTAIPAGSHYSAEYDGVVFSGTAASQSCHNVQYNIRPNFGTVERSGRFRLFFKENGQKMTSEWVNVTQEVGEYSKDYSQDGKVTVLQSHKKGSGIPVVIVGDGFMDSDIASGKYSRAMYDACWYFFSAEPLSSLRDYFDVWAVTAVSPATSFDGTSTRFQCSFGSGTQINGDNATAYEYASKAVPSDKVDDMLVIVVINTAKYAGTAYMYYDISYPSGRYYFTHSIVYVPMCDQYGMTFEDIIHHEACGHGFGKLADEYSDKGTISASQLSSLRKFQEGGAYRNVDEHSNVNETSWAGYANDYRFSYENIGAYEGAYTFDRGVFRPTESSIMRYNKGFFNAPSRALIYSRAMSISNNWNWSFDYEEFVKFDEPARNRIYYSPSNAARSSAAKYEDVHSSFTPLGPPVFILKQK